MYLDKNMFSFVNKANIFFLKSFITKELLLFFSKLKFYDIQIEFLAFCSYTFYFLYKVLFLRPDA